MQPEFWNDKRPAGVPDSLDFAAYRSVVEVFERSCKKFADRPAFSNLGVTLSYAELDRLSAAFAAYLQKQTDLQPGDRIAVQMPNVLQYPIAVFGALRAGLVVVNTNPLYTAREMRHQFKDAGVRALVYLNVFGKLVEEVLPDTRIEYLIEARMGDLLPALKGWLVNSVVKSVKKMVPDYRLPQALPFRQALKQGQGHALQPVRVGLEDVAVLQYTGGTTGVSKGAMLTHGNLVANMLQVHAQLSQLGKDGLPLMKEAQEVMIAPLPLYHIYAFTANCMCMMVSGNHNVLITNPRDIPSFIKELKKWRFSALLGLNTLFVALMEHPGFKDVDFSNLKLTNSGGTALVSATAERWKGVTGCTVVEGYGLTECSPVVTTNPYGEQARLGTVGIPVVGTALKVIDEQGNEPACRRTWRTLCERSASDEGVLAASRGHRGDSRCRRLAEDRRHRGDRRGRLRAYRRSQEGPDPGLWLQCLPQRDRRRGDGPSEGGQLRGGGHSRREVRRGGEAVRGGPRPQPVGRGAQGLLQGKPHRIQNSATDCAQGCITDDACG